MTLATQATALTSAFSLMSLLCVLSLLAHVGWFTGRISRLGLTLLALLAALSLLLVLVLRSVEAGFLTISTMYESVLLVSAAAQLGLLWLLRLYPDQTLLRLLGQVAVWALLLFATALVTDVTPLQASLRSYWRAIHVPIILTSYALLTLNLVATLVNQWQLSRRLPQQRSADAAFQAAVVGFPLLIIGVMLGAVWANEAWGTYWNWDPKESMALATLLGYAVYIHAKLNTNLSQQALNALAVGAFLLLVVTYVGVNLMGVGLHAYGAFSL
jgi:ABC-type transport system involved in cytochrome c biogenesis permease subunit